MIVADTSVWIDYLRNVPTWQAAELDARLGGQQIIMGDLILLEILQGYSSEREAAEVAEQLELLTGIEISGFEIANSAARNYRLLRRAGVTVRSTIDTLIATRCIEDDLVLLHGDRDFDPFVKHLGLRVIEQQLN